MAKRPSRSAKVQSSAASGTRKGAPPVHTATSEPKRRSTYFEAVAVYERGIEALQRHDYHKATSLLESVLRQYPEERELHERVRLYLTICQRQAAQQKTAPQTIDERLYAATIAINGGQYDQALAHLRLVRDEDPDNDHALYMLAVAHAQRLEHAEAVAHLERAIALNPENRGLARTDPDLEPIRSDEAFRAALDAPAAPRVERTERPIPPRRPLKARTGR
jgi:outer membrane protein assembly factor BamD (BamD/ComL family)